MLLPLLTKEFEEAEEGDVQSMTATMKQMMDEMKGPLQFVRDAASHTTQAVQTA